jgi:glycosyltransferase involved in cell wall biosynthesis
VQDGVTGVLARSGDPKDLADALARLLESPQRRAEIAAAGRESYLAEYTTAAMRRRFFERMAEISDARGR